MVLRQSLGRKSSRLLRSPSTLIAPVQCRGLASPSSGSFDYQSGEASGVKFASRDLAGPTSTLALVAKAGTRYQPLPGLAEGLEKYAFRNTDRRSALRLQREAELFGASLFSYHTRESVIIGAKFFRDDLPYFVEALSEVASMTKYLDYEFVEHVMDMIHRTQVDAFKDASVAANQSAHGLAFHRGLGEPLHPTAPAPLAKYLSHDAIGAYSTLAYRKSNVALVGNGTETADLEKWTSQFFTDLRTSPAAGAPELTGTEQTKYYGGEERISHSNKNALVLAFPGSSSLTGGFYKPEIAVLAALLGGRSAIKWSPGFSLLGKLAAQNPGLSVKTESNIYSDAGLLTITLSGRAEAVRSGAFEAVDILKKVADGTISSEDITKARAHARFAELEHGQDIRAGLELTGNGLVNNGKPYQLDDSARRIGDVTEKQVREAAKTMFQFKASVASVGDLFQLPYAEEMGLQV